MENILRTKEVTEHPGTEVQRLLNYYLFTITFNADTFKSDINKIMLEEQERVHVASIGRSYVLSRGNTNLEREKTQHEE